MFPFLRIPELSQASATSFLFLTIAALNWLNQSYVTTDDQSASLVFVSSPIWGPRPDFYYCQTVAGLLMWGALSDERRVCRLQLFLAFASAVTLGSESRGTHDHILLSQILDSPNLEGQVHVFISPRNRVAQLYPQALGSFFVAFYDSKGYGGGIRPCLQTGRGDPKSKS
jgi:hypothetical protein